MAIAQGKPPGDISLLLLNNVETVDSDSVLASRFLHSALPPCWNFEPQNRPPISTLLSQISDLSSQTETENEGVASGDSQSQKALSNFTSQRENSLNGNGSRKAMSLSVSLQDPSRCCGGVEGTQMDKQKAPTDAYLKGSRATEEDLGKDQGGSGMRGVASRQSHLTEGDKNITQITPDRSSPKISISRFHILILLAASTLSLCANIFLLFRGVDPLRPRDEEAARPTYQRRDL